MDDLVARLDGDEAELGAVVLTSYALVRGDERLLGWFTFDAVVLDEAQNIKKFDVV